MFEDAEKMKISQLLQRRYGKSKILFSDGNGNVYNKINGSCNIADHIAVLYDMSPEIMTLVNTFYSQYKLVKKSKFTKVYFILIPCIEYFVLKEFAYEYLSSEIQDILDFRYHYKEVSCYRKIKTYEGLCKELLAEKIGCLNQKGKGTTFYDGDCTCVNCRYETMRGTEIEKAYRLYEALPVRFVSLSDKSDVNQERILMNLQNKYLESYNNWVKQLWNKGSIKWNTTIVLPQE